MDITPEIASVYDGIKLNIENVQKDEDAKTLIPIAKKMIFGDKSSEMNYNKACRVLDYIIKDICNLDEKTFLSLYNTAMLRNMRIKNLTEYIIKNAPNEILKECAFENKRILFASVWKNFYDTEFSKLTTDDIFYCKGELKGGLIKAAASKIDVIYAGEDIAGEKKKDGTYKKYHASNGNIYGQVVDKIVYSALDDIFNRANLSFPEKLKYLAECKKTCKEKNLTPPGIFSVIDARMCYECPLDFFMFNSPENLQIKYIDEYMAFRRKGLYPANPVLDAIYEAYRMEFVKMDNKNYEAYDEATLDNYFKGKVDKIDHISNNLQKFLEQQEEILSAEKKNKSKEEEVER